MNAFVEDYSFLRAQGVPNRAIAVRFGIQWESLRRNCARHNCWIPDAVERRAHLRLVEMRDSGQPFPLDAVGPTSHVVAGLLSREIRAGRLEKVAPRRYRGVAA